MKNLCYYKNFLSKKIRDMSLIKKLTLAYTIAILIPTVSIGTYSYYETEKRVKQDIVKHFQKIHLQSINTIQQKINITESVSKQIASNKNIKTFLENKFVFDYNAMEYYRYYIVSLINNAKSFHEDNLYNVGLFINNSTIPESWGALYYDSHIKEFTWYSDFKQSPKESAWIYRPKASFFKGHSSEKIGETFTYTKKIFSYDNNYLGIVTIDILKDHMLSSFKNIYKNTDNCCAFILDFNKNFLFSTDNINKLEESNLVQKYAINDSGYFIINNTAYIYDKINSLGIVAVSKIKLDKFMKDQKYANKTMLYVIFLGIVFLEIITYKIIKLISSKLSQIVNTMNIVAKGNFDIQLPVESNDEIGQLVNNFNVLIKKINTLVEDLIKKEVAQTDAHLKALRYQINQHFIYNTLDIFRMRMILNNDFETAETFTYFCKMLRYNMSNQSTYTTIKAEVEYVEEYFNIQKLRYEDRIHLSISLPPELEKLKILKFILQPIVENSIKHGLTKRDQILHINIEFIMCKSNLLITIIDDGFGVDSAQLEHINEKIKNFNNYKDETSEDSYIGLRNISNRLNLYYGNNSTMILDSIHGKYTKVTITVPYNTI